MKKLFLLLCLCCAFTAYASNINLHLTGCVSDETNPTTYTDKDQSGVTLKFTALDGYTLNGWEVVVKHGETVIPNNDWTSEIGYVYPDPSYGVFIFWADEITADFDVTVICPKAQSITLPETFSAATFEEFTIGTNSIYRPESFVIGENMWLSGAVAFNTSVQDWGSGYFGYTSTQILNTDAEQSISGADAYLPTVAGAAEGKNYATINIMGAFEQIYFTKTTVSGMAVTNTNFNVNAILKGDGMSQEEAGNSLPFHQDDYFVLTIKGLDGKEVKGTIDYYLADFRTAGDWKYAKDWQWVELSSLGEIDGLQFELNSTKRNSYGMTTASYFAIDNFGGKKSDCQLGEMTHVSTTAIDQLKQNNETAHKMLKNGRLIIVRNGNRYNVAGQME